MMPHVINLMVSLIDLHTLHVFHALFFLCRFPRIDPCCWRPEVLSRADQSETAAPYLSQIRFWDASVAPRSAANLWPKECEALSLKKKKTIANLKIPLPILGVHTADIITVYISAIKALRELDPSMVILQVACQPIRKYLRLDTLLYLCHNLKFLCFMLFYVTMLSLCF